MSTAKELVQELHDLTQRMIRTTLMDEFNYPRVKKTGKQIEIGFARGTSGVGYGDIPYPDIYKEVADANLFNFKMLDGGLISLQYVFFKDVIQRHRLCFWASPDLQQFQNNPEVFEEDELYADFLNPSLVPFPFRIDFDHDEKIAVAVEHPRCHITFGSYSSCRVPVSAPVGPATFVKFILRNLYNTAFKKYESEIEFDGAVFDRSIFPEEEAIPHINLLQTN